MRNSEGCLEGNTVCKWDYLKGQFGREFFWIIKKWEANELTWFGI